MANEPSKACPFCSSTSAQIVSTRAGGLHHWHVCCTGCFAQGPERASRDEAISFWEMRVSKLGEKDSTEPPGGIQ